MTDILAKKNAKKFHCENCNFICSKKSNYDKHLLTPKHQNTDKILTNTDAENAENANVTNIFVCECGNNYKHRQSLFNHKKKCHILNINNEELNTEDLNNEITPELIMCVLQQNKELQKMLIEQGKTIMELSKNSSNTNISNNNINSHNKTFNLQFFLNETCKDAMNIMDFVDSIKLQLCDLENVGKLGFVEGISKIIVSNLNSLDETKRPVHCTDSKREIMYVKDEDKWEKENETKQKMRKVIKHVTHKNSKLLKEFKTKYPGCEKSESRFSTAYDKLIIEAMGGKGDNDLEKEDKIIKNIAKNVIIDKHIGI
jgi:hypothetical protein